MARKTPSKRAARTEPAAGTADVGAIDTPEAAAAIAADTLATASASASGIPVASAEPPARGKLRLRSRVDVMRGKEMRRITPDAHGEVAASEFTKEELQSLRAAGVVVEG